MTDVQESNMSLGIRLFGATISVKQIRSHGESKNSADDPTAAKRPDKIIPCPRCKSMETKFCYFNNYNVNQPRHFCKGCQRYWTAGGALRNVPVGAGRRKAKPLCPAPSEAGCFFDSPSTGGAQQLDFEEWPASERGGFEHLFAVKRRRFSDDVGSETCN